MFQVVVDKVSSREVLPSFFSSKKTYCSYEKQSTFSNRRGILQSSLLIQVCSLSSCFCSRFSEKDIQLSSLKLKKVLFSFSDVNSVSFVLPNASLVSFVPLVLAFFLLPIGPKVKEIGSVVRPPKG